MANAAKMSEQLMPMMTSVAGNTMQIASSLKGAKEAKKSIYQNAQGIELAADKHMLQAGEKEDDLRANARQIIGKQLAAGAQSGVALSGSRLDMLHGSYRNLESDVAGIRGDALENYVGMRNQAKMMRWQADRAYKAAKFGAAFSALGAGVSAKAYADKLPKNKSPQKKSGSAALLNSNWYGNAVIALNTRPKKSNNFYQNALVKLRNKSKV